MQFQFKGKVYDYSIDDDKITISKKNKIVFSGNIKDIIILGFVEKNILGAGQIVLSLPDRKRAFVDGFREKHRSDFIKLFQILKDKTEFLNLSYIKAINYIDPEIKEETKEEPEENAKNEQRKKKWELLKRGFKLIEEIKCVCTQCNTTWFYGKEDKIDNISNRLISLGAHMQGKSLTGSYHEQLIKDPDKCPKCGSRAIAKTKVKYWFNSKTGESIDYKE